MELVEIREQFPKSFFIKGVEEFGGDTENGTMDYSTFSKFMQALSGTDEGLSYSRYLECIELINGDEDAGISYDGFLEILFKTQGENKESSIKKEQDKSVRQQEYVGTIRKCPSCGSEIPSLTAICPNCGHELANVTESEAMKKFQEGLTKLDGKAQADFIASFSIPNTREDLGNFLITISSILKADLENDADRQRIVSLTSKFNEIKSKISTILQENDPLQQKANSWLNSLNSAMDAFDTRGKERIKKSNKFKNKHPILHRMFFLIKVAVAGIVALTIIFTIAYGKEAGWFHKGNTVSIAQKNIHIPAEYDSYFEVESDGEIVTYKGNANYSVSIDLKCLKKLPENLTKGSFYINGNYMSYDEEKMLTTTMLSAKPGKSINVIISGKSGNIEKDFDNAKQIVLTFDKRK